MSVSDNIIKLRERLGLNQSDLARMLLINRSVLNRIERGTRPVRDDELKIFADFFNVSTDYLLDKETPSSKFSRDETNLVYDYRWLDDDSKNLVLNMIKKLRGIAQSKSSKISVIQNSKNGSNYGVVGGNFNSNVTIV